MINRLNGLLGVVAAWLFVLTGAMLAWEVAARYLFNAPTIWAAELSQLLLIWGTFLAAAALLKDGRHITITMITGRLGRSGRLAAEVLATAVIFLFAVWIAWHGFEIFADSFVRGRSTGTMMNLPNWIAEASIPVGFTLLALQAGANLTRLVRTGEPSASARPAEH